MKLFLKTLVFLLAIVLSGCAAKAPYFTETIAPPTDKTIIYIYRPWTFVSGGVSFPVVVNNKRISPFLSNQSYLTYTTTPGKITIHTDTPDIDRFLEFDAVVGEEYFVSISMKDYFAVLAHVPYLVEKELAIKELKKCQLAL